MYLFLFFYIIFLYIYIYIYSYTYTYVYKSFERYRENIFLNRKVRLTSKKDYSPRRGKWSLTSLVIVSFCDFEEEKVDFIYVRVGILGKVAFQRLKSCTIRAHRNIERSFSVVYQIRTADLCPLYFEIPSPVRSVCRLWCSFALP